MTDHRNPPRILIDEHFLIELFQLKEHGPVYLKKLSAIHVRAGEHQWSHVQVLDTCFRAAIKNKEIRVGGLLGAMHPVQYWDEEGLHSSVIKHAIALADKSPFETVILTGSAQHATYLANKHYGHEQVKAAVTIRAGSDALALIDDIYEKCCDRRQNDNL